MSEKGPKPVRLSSTQSLDFLRQEMSDAFKQSFLRMASESRDDWHLRMASEPRVRDDWDQVHLDLQRVLGF
eukprot:s5305_g6.t1